MLKQLVHLYVLVCHWQYFWKKCWLPSLLKLEGFCLFSTAVWPVTGALKLLSSVSFCDFSLCMYDILSGLKKGNISIGVIFSYKCNTQASVDPENKSHSVNDRFRTMSACMLKTITCCGYLRLATAPTLSSNKTLTLAPTLATMQPCSTITISSFVLSLFVHLYVFTSFNSLDSFSIFKTDLHVFIL